MGFAEILLIAISVSVDAFAVSVGGALSDHSGRRCRNAMRAALFFGGFQILMPVFGFGAATLLAPVVEQLDHWLAFILLGAVGGKMIVEGVRPEASVEGREKCDDFFGWKALLVPAVATSLDALAVGAGIAFARAPILIPALAMGVVTAAVSALGVVIGNRLGRSAGARMMTVIGGAVIFGIGLKILLEHVDVL